MDSPTRPPRLDDHTGWWLLAFIAYLALILWTLGVFGTAHAEAASLRVCIADTLPSDVAAVPVFLNAQPFAPDLLVNSSAQGTSRCNTFSIPATLVRGADQSVTVKAQNALGEVSAASNALPFRLPSTPPIPTLDSVSVVVP